MAIDLGLRRLTGMDSAVDTTGIDAGLAAGGLEVGRGRQLECGTDRGGNGGCLSRPAPMIRHWRAGDLPRLVATALSRKGRGLH